ncbi:toll/interleukin-1 receptor domain-containing protein [Mycolicibacterium goodii]|uniref:toll/interleukin-1 receptor domain-containing protein n=1 Tax=Mycolicibacterium goodii TaxID=134601 RepID=UPI001BDDA21C|nr:toll/interleukin-1 receptor domain-containing protein [Mycolicibacterium goodii]MBU8821043.1 toll/interleukin-1 receptor domain-containing protein [Mycolicibacterium goodii]
MSSNYQRQVNEYNRRVREHNRRVAREYERQVNDYTRKVNEHNRKVARENQRAVDEYNRKAQRHNDEVRRQAEKAQRENARAVNNYNQHVAQVNQHNRQVDARKNAVISDLTRRLNTTRYSPEEEQLAQRVAEVIAAQEARETDVFLSYAQIDGTEVGRELCARLEALGVRVWFDEVAIQPGKSQARQMDIGLAKAHCGVALLTPAYIAGRFWTERELGVLLGKDTLIPVLDGVTFEQVKEYSGILPDLAGFETARHSVAEIADKIAAAVLKRGAE